LQKVSSHIELSTVHSGTDRVIKGPDQQ
jgi:hypothetical protein